VLSIPDPRCDKFDWKQVEPMADFKDMRSDWDRDEAYHLGRVRYFMDQFAAQAEVDPIHIDARWNRYNPEDLELLDGHHRLAGAFLAGVPVIPAACSGPVEMIEWLEGKHDNKPEWIL
jgi:hypothetical protein